jgi:anti-sigma regulatory factor (Ser/Thr protein kinase)
MSCGAHRSCRPRPSTFTSPQLPGLGHDRRPDPHHRRRTCPRHCRCHYRRDSGHSLGALPDQPRDRCRRPGCTRGLQRADGDLRAKDIARRLRQAATAADVRIDVETRPATILSDARLLETILSNLLSNAIRYTPAGGHLQIRVRRRRRDVVLAVRDNGVGIAPEQRQRIFERLYRVDQTRDRAPGGLGLGLAITARAAQTLGGASNLTARSGTEANSGSSCPSRPTAFTYSARVMAERRPVAN